MTGLTASEWAKAHGISVRHARFLMATGQVPGAIRLGSPGSPWVVLDEHTAQGPAAVNGSRALADSTTGVTAPHSTPEQPQPIAQLLTIVAAVQGITTRPARAIPAAGTVLLLVAQRHAMNRDGACGHCQWTWPCPDYVDATTALTAMHDTITAGAA